MILNHGNHGMLNVLLVLAQLGRHLLLELLGEGLDDHVAVCDLLAVELDEGQHPLLGAVLALVVHILKQASVRSEQSSVECNMYCARVL